MVDRVSREYPEAFAKTCRHLGGRDGRYIYGWAAVQGRVQQVAYVTGPNTRMVWKTR